MHRAHLIKSDKKIFNACLTPKKSCENRLALTSKCYLNASTTVFSVSEMRRAHLITSDKKIFSVFLTSKRSCDKWKKNFRGRWSSHRFGG